MTATQHHTEVDANADWEAAWRTVGSEDWLTAKALLELSPALLREASAWVAGHDGQPGELIGWVEDVDRRGRGWSSTEGRLFRVVAALLDPSPDVLDAREVGYGMQMNEDRVLRGVPLVYFLELMGSWEGEVWRILTEWGTGGNNREHRGRHTVVPS